jgi:hypothetical protein
MHFLIVVPTVLLGVLLIWLDRVSWRDLVASAAQIRRLGAPSPPPDVERVAENSP